MTVKTVAEIEADADDFFGAQRVAIEVAAGGNAPTMPPLPYGNDPRKDLDGRMSYITVKLDDGRLLALRYKEKSGEVAAIITGMGAEWTEIAMDDALKAKFLAGRGCGMTAPTRLEDGSYAMGIRKLDVSSAVMQAANRRDFAFRIADDLKSVFLVQDPPKP